MASEPNDALASGGLKIDIPLIAITGIIAGCGLIYEYLLSHYAARVLGAVETVIFTIISLMIVSMGVGAFLSGRVKDPFKGFVALELTMALTGSLAVLICGGVMAGAHILPRLISETLKLPEGLPLDGGIFVTLSAIAEFSPYVMACILGLFIGMEIPLLARVREHMYGRHLKNNIGTIYGADYIGAGLGAVAWVGWMLTLEPALAGALTAAANLAVGLFFVLKFYDRINFREFYLAAHGILIALVLIVAYQGPSWQALAENVMYADRVIYRLDTKYQRLVITRREHGPDNQALLTFHINGRVQFASNDENIYHAMLVNPAMMASARHDNVLIVGGGDGLALRDVLKWKPQKVMLLDLDAELVAFFKDEVASGVNRPLIKLNRRAFSDPRVETRFGDAWLTADQLISEGARFDVIIVDLPDPSHPDLNKLYATGFYAKLRTLLAGDGAIAVQSTSPYHAKRTFISIGKTVAAAGFAKVAQYHANVPSFGEWGWTLAVPHGKPPQSRIKSFSGDMPKSWSSKELILASFVFGRDYFANNSGILVNRARSSTIYRYYLEDWQEVAEQ